MKRLAAVAVFILMFAAVSLSGVGASVPGKGFTETGCDAYSDSVARLYTAGLGREPEQGGFEFWMAEYTAGRWQLPKMASFFTQSPEFQTSYGALTQDGFIRQLYRNVLGREGEQGGVTFWNGQMSAGMDRGTVLLSFAESPENITNSGTTDPALGPFNVGLPGPWSCTGGTPPSAGATGKSPDDPLPMGSGFSTQPYIFSNARYDGQVVALVEGQRSRFNDDPGRCLFVVGTLTPTQLDEGNVSSWLDTPDFSLLGGGRRLQSTAVQCDWTGLEASGWRWTLDMETTLGTSYPFFEEIFLPADGPQSPTAIVLGNPATNDALYFEAPVRQTIPSLPATPSGPNTFLATSPGFGTTFFVREAFSGVTWRGRLTALVDGAPSRFGGSGDCVFVLGELTPTVIDEGIVTSGFDTPTINLLSNGRVIETSGGQCDTQPIDAAGWEWILNAEISVGTTYAFYAEIKIEDSDPFNPQAIIVGSPFSAEALFFRTPQLAASPPIR